jgi:hypothetical protein
VAVLLKCPNCGAPLEGAKLGSLRECPYCRSLIALPEPSAPATAPLHPPRSARRGATWLALGGVLVVGALGLTAVFLSTFRTQKVAAKVAWQRLDAIDPSLKLARAQVELPKSFPEVTTDVHRKEFHFNLQHRVLNRGFLSWEWGCDCLERMVFFFSDYPTRQRANESFIPCLARELGETSKSAPPFDFEWAAHAGAPRVHLGPQTLSLDFSDERSQAGLRRVLAALARCDQ